MPYVENDGVKIAFEETGSGRPVMLVHGFAASRTSNWSGAGWFDALTASGRRVIAIDCRGHGESDKPHDPSAYGNTMADDVIAVLDHLGIDRCELMGYSMGGRISLRLLTAFGDRFSCAVLGGIGGGVGGPRRNADEMARAMEADELPADASDMAKGFRLFAEASGNDLKALAAVMRGWGTWSVDDDLATIDTPTLVVVGSDDDLVGSAEPLVEQIPGARLEVIPGRDHLTVVGDERYKQAAIAFLDEHR